MVLHDKIAVVLLDEVATVIFLVEGFLVGHDGEWKISVTHLGRVVIWCIC